MVQIDVSCPHCKRSLMDPDHPIDGHPSVGLVIDVDGEKRWLRLSGLYGSYNIESEVAITEGSVSAFSCPHCGADLTVTRTCNICKAPMAGMQCVQGGLAEFCSRRGCRKHLIEFEDIEVGLKAFYKAYPLFFRGE